MTCKICGGCPSTCTGQIGPDGMREHSEPESMTQPAIHADGCCARALVSIRDEFKEHHLTDEAKAKTEELARAYSRLIGELERLCPPGRYLALAKTGLEQSYWAAIQSTATAPINQRTFEPARRIGGNRHG